MTTSKPPAESTPTSTTPPETKPVAEGVAASPPGKDETEPDLLPIVRE